MNFRNLAMWAVIIVLTIGLYNMFKNPQRSSVQNNNIIFSEFLTEVENGRVVKVDIQGNNISGVMSNGENFTTYSPNDPNLIQTLIWSITIMVPNVAINCSVDIFYETNARRQRWSNGIWKI